MYLFIYSRRSVAAFSGETLDAITAAVSPFSPCIFVHHSSCGLISCYLDCGVFLNTRGRRWHTIWSIFSFDWCTTTPQPSSSITSKSPLVIMQNISMITSFSRSNPVICVVANQRRAQRPELSQIELTSQSIQTRGFLIFGWAIMKSTRSFLGLWVLIWWC